MNPTDTRRFLLALSGAVLASGLAAAVHAFVRLAGIRPEAYHINLARASMFIVASALAVLAIDTFRKITRKIPVTQETFLQTAGCLLLAGNIVCIAAIFSSDYLYGQKDLVNGYFIKGEILWVALVSLFIVRYEVKTLVLPLTATMLLALQAGTFAVLTLTPVSAQLAYAAAVALALGFARSRLRSRAATRSQ